MSDESVLPRGATRVELAIETVTARAARTPVPISDLADFDLAPADFIPFLAWGHSSDLWDRDWPIEKKRAVAKSWLRLHRKKGTLAGIEDAVRFFGGEVVAARVPPDATYPDPALTREERDRYLSRFRQLRLYRFRSRGTAAFGAYAASGYRLPRLFAGTGFYPTFTDAPVRVGRRAFIFDPLTGTEEPVKRAVRVSITETRGAVDFEEMALPGKAGRGFFVGRLRESRRFSVNTGARKRLFSIAIDREYLETRSALHISGVLPSTQPINVRPRLARLPGQRVIGQLFPSRKGGGRNFIGRSGDGVYRKFLPPSSAPLRVFDQVYLWDQDRLPDKRGARTFVGRIRLGQAPYHARLTIEVKGRASPFAFRSFVGGHLLTTSKKRMRQVIEAVRQSKALRDKVLVSTKTMRPVSVSDRFQIGTIKVGAWVRDV